VLTERPSWVSQIVKTISTKSSFYFLAQPVVLHTHHCVARMTRNSIQAAVGGATEHIVEQAQESHTTEQQLMDPQQLLDNAELQRETV